MKKTKYEMSPANLQRIRRWMSLLLGVLILAVGVALMVTCLTIYLNGQAPFTREAIGAGLRRVAPLIVACAICLLADALVALVVSLKGGFGALDENKRVKAVRYPSVLLRKQTEHLNMEAIPADYRHKISRERALRHRISVVTALLSVGFALPAVVWCVDVTRFSVDRVNSDVTDAAMVILGCSVLELSVWITAAFFREASVLRELALIKTVKASLGREGLRMEEGHVKKSLSDRPYPLWILRGGIAVVAILLIVLGVCNGGMADVLGKAIRICTECIGLG